MFDQTGYCLTESLHLPNGGSLFQRKTSIFIKQSLCLNQTGHLYMFDFSICILYAVMLNPGPRAYYAVLANLRPFLVSSSNLGNF